MNGFTVTGIATTCDVCGDTWVVPAAPGTHSCRRVRTGAVPASTKQGGGHLYTTGVENSMFSGLANSQPVCVSCGGQGVSGALCPDGRPLRARLAQHAPSLLGRFDAALTGASDATAASGTPAAVAASPVASSPVASGPAHNSATPEVSASSRPTRRSTVRTRTSRPAPPPPPPPPPTNGTESTGTFRRRSIFLSPPT